MKVTVLAEGTQGHLTGAAIRHEIWQYTNNYGGWAKERRTRVLDRSILPRGDLRKWTWLWDPRLGAIVVKDAPVKIEPPRKVPSSPRKPCMPPPPKPAASPTA